MKIIVFLTPLICTRSGSGRGFGSGQKVKTLLKEIYIFVPFTYSPSEVL